MSIQHLLHADVTRVVVVALVAAIVLLSTLAITLTEMVVP